METKTVQLTLPFGSFINKPLEELATYSAEAFLWVVLSDPSIQGHFKFSGKDIVTIINKVLVKD